MLEVSKYKSLYSWKKNQEGAYKAAKRLGLIEKICKTFGWKYKPNSKKRKKIGFWTLERCIEESKKYMSKNEWKTKSRGSYSAASKNKWTDKCCGHMKTGLYAPIKPTNYWTFEKCIEEAKKYTAKADWRKASRGSHEAAYKNGWMEKCTEHMIVSKYAKRKF